MKHGLDRVPSAGVAVEVALGGTAFDCWTVGRDKGGVGGGASFVVFCLDIGDDDVVGGFATL